MNEDFITKEDINTIQQDMECAIKHNPVFKNMEELINKKDTNIKHSPLTEEDRNTKIDLLYAKFCELSERTTK